MKRMKAVLFLLVVSAIFSLFIGGCVTTYPVGPAGLYSVKVNSITNADVELKDKTYILKMLTKTICSSKSLRGI